MKSLRIVLLPILVLFLCNCTCSKSDPCPSDQILIDRFTANESSFTALSQDPQNSELRSQLGIIDFTSFSEEVTVHTFIVWRKDLVGPGGFSKGYYYCDIEPPRLVDSIDAIYDSTPAEQCEVFRPIKGPWYLYYSSSN
jgi:hypothetical protein